MKTFIKKSLALMLGAAVLLGLLAGCGTHAADPGKTGSPSAQAPELTGMLVLTANASFKISYDQDGMVMEVAAGNEEAAAIVESYTDYIGKSCSTAVKELLAATAEATLLRSAKNIVLKLAVGSRLPSETFLDGLAHDASTAVADNGASGFVVAIGLDALDEEGYINAETAQNLLKNQLGVTEFDSYNGDTTPRNGCYTVYVKAGEVEGAYQIDAVTGIISEIIEEESAEPDYVEEEEFDSVMEEVEDEIVDEDEEFEEEAPEGDPAE